MSDNAKFSFQNHARYMGRINFDEPDAPEMSWSNSAIFLTVNAPELVMHTKPGSNNGNTCLEIVLDGAPVNYILLEPDKDDYTVFSGLTGTHTVELHKRTERLTGGIRICGFTLPQGGEFLAPPPANKLKLEYFGDSITCGAGAAREHLAPNNPLDTDAFRSYVGISARMLMADYHTISISGCGMIQDCMGGGGVVPPNFTGGCGKDPWDFSKFMADGVIINLGQNDFSAPIDTEKYEKRYSEFIDEIRAAYKDPYIFCCVGTMNDNYLPHVKNVVEKANAEGKNKVHLVDLGVIIPEVEGWGGMFHPGLQAHYRMGIDLANRISEITGWPLRKRPTGSTIR